MLAQWKTITIEKKKTKTEDDVVQVEILSKMPFLETDLLGPNALDSANGVVKFFRELYSQRPSLKNRSQSNWDSDYWDVSILSYLFNGKPTRIFLTFITKTKPKGKRFVAEIIYANNFPRLFFYTHYETGFRSLGFLIRIKTPNEDLKTFIRYRQQIQPTGIENVILVEGRSGLQILDDSNNEDIRMTIPEDLNVPIDDILRITVDQADEEYDEIEL